MQSLVDEGFAFGVEGGSCFVENQDIGIFEQGAGDGDALFLAARELGAAGADEGFEAFGLEILSAWTSIC